MIENDFGFPRDIYEQYLSTINGINFTPREIDIIAFINNGRSNKKIAAFFSISPKTVETHTRNIMSKVDRNSREGIIDYIEKSEKFSYVRKYYVSLLVHEKFKSALKAISLTHNKLKALLVLWQSQEQPYVPVSYLKEHLKLAGINITLDHRVQAKSIKDLLAEPTLSFKRIFLFPKLNPYQAQDANLSNELREQLYSKNIFIVASNDEIPQEIGHISYLSLSQHKSYYAFVFEILKKLLPNESLETSFATFQKNIKTLSDPLETQNIPLHITHKHIQQKSKPLKISLATFSRNKNFLYVLVLAGLCLGTSWISYSIYQNTLANSSNYQIQPHKFSSIRSDLIIPTDSVLLNRQDLLRQIERLFNEQKTNPIQSLALIGIGGAGKTTLARQFARLQKSPVVWEFNAETKESLALTFEHLAYALERTEEEKRELRELLDIKNPSERERKLIQWVKNHLKLYQPWVLIFDNVEKFSDIEKYYPYDSEVWGNGRVIMTTRNHKLQNNNQIEGMLPIQELSNDQKYQLFSQIMYKGGSKTLNQSEREQIKRFLKEIPPFPLDIVVSAYYLKITNLSCKDYLDYINRHNENFEIVQKNILKEVGQYTKTRYSIIALSLSQILNEHKEFRDLLLLISLIDSQNIPRDLLKAYKSNTIVDHFIFHLKNYFLITNQSSTNEKTYFAIHRSTQTLSLAYLMNMLNLEKNSSIIEPIAESLIKYSSKVVDAHDFYTMNLLVNHCESFLKHKRIVNNSMTGSVQGELGGIFFYLGRYKKAIFNLEQSLNLLNKEPHKNLVEIARSLRHLGNVYRDLGNYSKSQDLFEQSHVIYDQHLSHNHAGIARSFTYLGLIYRNLGKYDKAREFLIRSISIYENNIKDVTSKQIGLARALAYLGSVDRIIGNYDTAKKSLEESLRIFEAHFPKDHQKVGWILAYLGNFYRDRGDYEKARTCLEESYKIYIKRFSINHLKVAWVSILLGNLYHEISDWNNAHKHLHQCFAVYEKEYGPNHIETAKVYRNLGYVNLGKNHLDAAERLMNQSLDILTKNEHPETFMSLEGLANLNLKKSMLATKDTNSSQASFYKKKAISYLQLALKAIIAHFNKDSVHIKRIQEKIQKIKL